MSTAITICVRRSIVLSCAGAIATSEERSDTDVASTATFSKTNAYADEGRRRQILDNISHRRKLLASIRESRIAVENSLRLRSSIDGADELILSKTNEINSGNPQLQIHKIVPAPHIGLGWTTQIKPRKNGKGNYRYFFSPAGKKFRSMVEVRKHQSLSAINELAMNENDQSTEEVLTDELDKSSVSQKCAAPAHNFILSSKGEPNAPRSRKNGIPWEQCIEALKNYHEKHGHCNVNQQKGEKQLANFIKKIREYKRRIENRTYNEHLLTADRIQQLDGMGFCWRARVKDTSFDGHLEDLKKYKELHGNCDVPAVYPDSMGLAR